MKVLFLGNSSEIYGDVPQSERRANRVGLALEEALGEPVEVVVRQIWPTPRLPGLLDRWMDEEKPDLVYLNVVSYWFQFQSVPLKVERMLGPLGKPARDVGVRASQTSWFGHTRVFFWLRGALQRTVGGATFFEPEQIIDVASDCIRAVVRHEEAVLLVKGPRGESDHSVSQKARRWAEARRQRVHRALAGLCAELHVDYVGTDVPRYRTETSVTRFGDRLHRDAEGHVRSGEEVADLLLAAWNRQRLEIGTR